MNNISVVNKNSYSYNATTIPRSQTLNNHDPAINTLTKFCNPENKQLPNETELQIKDAIKNLDLSAEAAKDILNSLTDKERNLVDTDAKNNIELSSATPSNVYSDVVELVSTAITKLSQLKPGWFGGYIENRTCAAIKNHLKEIISESAASESAKKRFLQQKYNDYIFDLGMLPITNPEKCQRLLDRAKEMFQIAHEYSLTLDISKLKHSDNTYKEVIIKLHNRNTEGAMKALLESGDCKKIDSIILLGLANTKEQREVVENAYKTALNKP